MIYRISLYDPHMAVVHRDDCRHRAAESGGPYATKGAAIDAGFSQRAQVWECTECITGRDRVNAPNPTG